MNLLKSYYPNTSKAFNFMLIEAIILTNETIFSITNGGSSKSAKEKTIN